MSEEDFKAEVYKYDKDIKNHHKEKKLLATAVKNGDFKKLRFGNAFFFRNLFSLFSIFSLHFFQTWLSKN
jgi:hypothetical protein